MIGESEGKGRELSVGWLAVVAQKCSFPVRESVCTLSRAYCMASYIRPKSEYDVCWTADGSATDTDEPHLSRRQEKHMVSPEKCPLIVVPCSTTAS